MSVPQHWDMDEMMPDVEYDAQQYINGLESYQELHGYRGFLAGAKAMWEKLKSEGRIKA